MTTNGLASTLVPLPGVAGIDIDAELEALVRPPNAMRTGGADGTVAELAKRRTHTTEEGATGSIDDGDAAITLHGVTKRYGQRVVLSDLQLSIERGSLVAIVGRSGCGKSTLLRLVAGLETVDEGSLRLHRDTASAKRTGSAGGGPHERRIGARTADAMPLDARMMFQDARLLPWKTVLQNVMLGLPRSAQDDARAVLDEVGLAERANDWPARLSGGQRQRVALARALVHRPELLLLDEPLGALDALTRIEMHALIERLWRVHRFTALLVTHDVHEAVALGDRIALIEGGRIALDQAVQLARPRARGSAAFAALEERVLQRVLQTGDGGEATHLQQTSVRHEAVRATQVRWAV